MPRLALPLMCALVWSCGPGAALVSVEEQGTPPTTSGAEVRAAPELAEAWGGGGLATVAAPLRQVGLAEALRAGGASEDAGASTTVTNGAGEAGSGASATDAGEGPAGGPPLASDAGLVAPDRESLDGGAGAGADPSSRDAGSTAGGTSEVLDAGALVIVVDAGTLDATTSDGGGAWGALLSVHTSLGLPSPATVGAPTQWLLVKPQYVTAYDTTRKTPRWVAWQVAPAWFGSAPRSSSFHQDAQLPPGTPQARDADYTHSGFDRGHLCPSADRTATADDNQATFTLTNVVPQTHASNAGPWEALETETRTWTSAGQQVLVVAGPIHGATRQTIGAGVEVPAATFKVEVVLGPGERVTASTRVVAVIIPNTLSVSGPWRPFRTTVREVERQTGLDLLSDVPREVQDQVETRVDTQ